MQSTIRSRRWLILFYKLACIHLFANLFINIVPTWFGGHVDPQIQLERWPVIQCALIFLGIPLGAGFITRFAFGSLNKQTIGMK
jgi:ACR3 family arsenite efflux pump ArsB